MSAVSDQAVVIVLDHEHPDAATLLPHVLRRLSAKIVCVIIVGAKIETADRHRIILNAADTQASPLRWLRCIDVGPHFFSIAVFAFDSPSVSVLRQVCEPLEALHELDSEVLAAQSRLWLRVGSALQRVVGVVVQHTPGVSDPVLLSFPPVHHSPGCFSEGRVPLACVAGGLSYVQVSEVDAGQALVALRVGVDEVVEKAGKAYCTKMLGGCPCTSAFTLHVILFQTFHITLPSTARSHIACNIACMFCT